MESQLPDDMVEKILSFLPIKIAANATRFSKKPIAKSWKLNRNLCFLQVEGNERVELINNVMSQHLGSKIDRLALRLNPVGHEDQIRGWIRMAVAKGVEELDLDFQEAAFPVHSDLMDSEFSRIRVLKLASCQVDFSRQQINGFRFVKTICFQNITILNSLMRSVLTNCLALEDLEIRDCNFQFNRLNISAGLLDRFKSLRVEHPQRYCGIVIYTRTLEEFTYSGQRCFIVFERPVPRLLTSVSLTSSQSRSVTKAAQTTDLAGAIRYCSKLQICGKIIQGLFPNSPANRYTDHHWGFLRLKDLTLLLNGKNIVRSGTSIITPFHIVYFLHRCPNLEKLFIDLGEYPFGLLWRLFAKEMFEMCPLEFQSLKNVHIKGFKYRRLEFQLLRMIVKRAPSFCSVTLVKSIVNSDSARDRELCLKWMKAQRCTFNIVNLPI